MTREGQAATLAARDAPGRDHPHEMSSAHRRDEARRGVPGRLLLLHPAVLFGAVWAVTFLIWVFSPQSVVNITFAGHRADLTTHAALYLIAGVAAFMAAAVIGSFTDARRQSRFATPPDAAARRTELDGLVFATRLLAVAALFGGLVWFARIAITLGGPVQFFTFLSGHDSVVELKGAVTDPSQLPPITTMVHLSPVVAGAFMFIRARRGWTTLDRVLLLSILIMTAGRAIWVAERLGVLGVGSAMVVAWIISNESLRAGPLLRWGIACLLVGWFAWTFGEFTRSWRATRLPGESTAVNLENYIDSLSYSHTRLGAYVFTALDGAIVVINEWPTQSFPRWTAEALPVPNAGTNEPDPFKTTLNPQFTGLTMLGALFIDAREFGIVLAALFGAAAGIVWRSAARGSPVGVVLYAACAFMILDSARMFYPLLGPSLGVYAGILFIWVMIKTRRTHPDRHALPAEAPTHSAAGLQPRGRAEAALPPARAIVRRSLQR